MLPRAQWSTCLVLFCVLCFGCRNTQQTTGNMDWICCLGRLFSTAVLQKDWSSSLAVVILSFFASSSLTSSVVFIEPDPDLSRYVRIILINLVYYSFHRRYVHLENNCNKHINYRSCLLYGRSNDLGVVQSCYIYCLFSYQSQTYVYIHICHKSLSI